MLFDLVKAFDKIEGSQKMYFSPKRPLFSMRAQHVLSYYLV